MIQNQTTALLTKNTYFAISTLKCKLHKDKVSVFHQVQAYNRGWLLNKQTDLNFSLNQTKSVSEWMSQWYLSSLTFHGVENSFPSFHFFSHFGGTSKEEKEPWEPRQEKNIYKKWTNVTRDNHIKILRSKLQMAIFAWL